MKPITYGGMPCSDLMQGEGLCPASTNNVPGLTDSPWGAYLFGGGDEGCVVGGGWGKQDEGWEGDLWLTCKINFKNFLNKNECTSQLCNIPISWDSPGIWTICFVSFFPRSKKTVPVFLLGNSFQSHKKNKNPPKTKKIYLSCLILHLEFWNFWIRHELKFFKRDFTYSLPWWMAWNSLQK